MKETAAQWWYEKVQAGSAPGTSADFATSVRNEFLPQDFVRKDRNTLRDLRQRTSASAYMNDFQNLIIAIPGIKEDEKLDKLVAGLKPLTLVDVLKINPQDIAVVPQIALNMDNVIAATYRSN